MAMTPPRIGIAGTAAPRFAERLRQAAQQHDAQLQAHALQPGDSPAAFAHVLLIAGDDDAVWRTTLSAGSTPWSVVHGDDGAAIEAAVNALTPLLLERAPSHGLLSRLQQRDAAQPAWRWVCEKCDSPECEHAMLKR
jgi:hypothetical protein